MGAARGVPQSLLSGPILRGEVERGVPQSLVPASFRGERSILDQAWGTPASLQSEQTSIGVSLLSLHPLPPTRPGQITTGVLPPGANVFRNKKLFLHECKRHTAGATQPSYPVQWGGRERAEWVLYVLSWSWATF